ncbi:MAG: hypothetical protein EOP00_35695 [Pedobacter sp.]|nr:MAG: hypothetical protein EOP00_35695 [Pedobacter sp.]
MIYAFLAFVIIIIGKFIYDSYLTNNTEKNWDSFKKANPQKAIVIENSKPFNLNTDAKLRKDGYYIAKFGGSNDSEENSQIHFLLLFTKNGFVAFEELENYGDFSKESPQEMQQMLIDADQLGLESLSSNFGKYKINDGKVIATFFDPNDNTNKDLQGQLYDELVTYTEWNGTIIHNGLILDFVTAYYDFRVRDWPRQLQISNLKFEFVQIQF